MADPATKDAATDQAKTADKKDTQPSEGEQGPAKKPAPAAGAKSAPAAAKDKTKASASGPTVVVKGPKKGRWRCGRHFGPEAVKIPLEELSKDEMAALKADPELIVTTVGTAD